MSKEHEHEYKEVVYKVQEAKIGHWDYEDHLITTLNHERVKLFCIKCGNVLEATDLANEPQTEAKASTPSQSQNHT